MKAIEIQNTKTKKQIENLKKQISNSEKLLKNIEPLMNTALEYLEKRFEDIDYVHIEEVLTHLKVDAEDLHYEPIKSRLKLELTKEGFLVSRNEIRLNKTTGLNNFFCDIFNYITNKPFDFFVLLMFWSFVAISASGFLVYIIQL